MRSAGTKDLIAGLSSGDDVARRRKVQLAVNGLNAICLSTDDYLKSGEIDAVVNRIGKGSAIDRDLFTQNMNDLPAEGR